MSTTMELEIGPGPEPGTFVVHVLRSVGGGEPTAAFRLDLDELLDRRPTLEDSVLSSSVAARRIVSATEAPIQRIGRLLFDSVFDGEVDAAYRTSLAVASDRGKGVQIVLRLTAPGLAALPWEALYDAETGSYLCRKEPLVRHVPAPYSPPTLTLTPPLRVLGMISSPRGLPPLDIDGEKELLEQALRPHLDAGRVTIDWIDHVTWPRVHDKLLEHEWHVLHFIGHGTYDAETDEGVLAFVGRDGRADYVSASSLADLLDQAEPSPRLVLLNSCRSGAGGTEDLFSGTAAALVHSGIHAVAAMQFSVSDFAAIEFARGFYAALAHGRGIDEAVRSGRIGMLGVTRGTLEWVTPVLYLRGEDTQLFEVAAAPEPEPAPSPALPRKPDAEPEPHAAPEPHVEPKPHPAPQPTTAVGTAHAPDSGDVPSASMPIIRPGHIAVGAAAAAAATPQRPFVTTSPDAPSTAPQRPVAPTVTPPPVARAVTQPVSPAPPPPPAPQVPRRSTPRWRPWLVVVLIAIIAIAGAATTLFVLRPWASSKDVQHPTAEPTEPTSTPTPTPTSPVEPSQVQTITVAAREPNWIPAGLSCEIGERFEMTATGTILQNPSEDSRVGPGGWPGDSPGYEGQYGFPPGALIGRLDIVPEHEGFAFVQDGPTIEHGAAIYTCQVAGNLLLGISDTDVSDNNDDAFSVEIRKYPAG